MTEFSILCRVLLLETCKGTHMMNAKHFSRLAQAPGHKHINIEPQLLLRKENNSFPKKKKKKNPYDNRSDISNSSTFIHVWNSHEM